jgi:hypothetical protein
MVRIWRRRSTTRVPRPGRSRRGAEASARGSGSSWALLRNQPIVTGGKTPSAPSLVAFEGDPQQSDIRVGTPATSSQEARSPPGRQAHAQCRCRSTRRPRPRRWATGTPGSTAAPSPGPSTRGARSSPARRSPDRPCCSRRHDGGRPAQPHRHHRRLAQRPPHGALTCTPSPTRNGRAAPHDAGPMSNTINWLICGHTRSRRR